MSDQMLQQIDQLLVERFEVLSDSFAQKLDQQSAEIKRHTGVLLDGVQHKFDLVIEGQQMLGERIDCVAQRVESVEKTVVQQSGQIHGIAADLKAHRADTEVHRGVYGVRED